MPVMEEESSEEDSSAGMDDMDDDLKGEQAGDYERRDKKEKHWTEEAWFNWIVGGVIMVNALIIGLDTDLGCRDKCNPGDRDIWTFFDYIFMVFFIIELVVRVADVKMEYLFRNYYNPGPGDKMFGKFPAIDAWNFMDMSLVIISIVDTVILPRMGDETDLGFLRVLRIIRMARLVRLVRLLRAFRELWLIVSGMFEAAKTLVWVTFLLIIIMYCCAIFITITVGQNREPYAFDFSQSQWTKDDYWGTVPASMYSLFQLITFDTWSMAMVRPIVVRSPAYMLFFLFFISVAGLGLLNIVVGVVVENTMASASENEEKLSRMIEKQRDKVMDSLRAIFEAADKDDSKTLDWTEFQHAMKQKHVRDRLQLIDIPVSDLNELYKLLQSSRPGREAEENGPITMDEFFKGCQKLQGVAKSRDIIELSKHVSEYNKKAEDLLKSMKGQSDTLTDVMNRLEVMDKDFLRTEDVHKRRKKQKKSTGEGDLPINPGSTLY